jgi:serine/threonine-protein kinase
MDAVVLECLEKDPWRRPATAEALWERLDRVPLPREWHQRHARTWWEMHEPELVGSSDSSPT